VLRAVVLQALAGEQMRQLAPGKKKQPVRAAALNDMVLNLQRILAGKKVPNGKLFLGALDKDTAAANATRTTLFANS